MQIHSIDQKKKDISLAKKPGPSVAATELGLPEGTVSCWSFKARRVEQEGQVWPPACENHAKPVSGSRWAEHRPCE